MEGLVYAADDNERQLIWSKYVVRMRRVLKKVRLSISQSGLADKSKEELDNFIAQALECNQILSNKTYIVASRQTASSPVRGAGDEEQFLEQLRHYVINKRISISKQNLRGQGRAIGQEYTGLFKYVLSHIMDFYVPDELKKNVALAAFGSVTREEMVRYSDGDLILLKTPVVSNDQYNELKRQIIRALEKAGYKGMSDDILPFGLIEEILENASCSHIDIDKVQDSVFIWGKEGVYNELLSQFMRDLDLDSKIQYYLTAAWYRHKFQRDHPFVRDSFNLKFFEGESAGCCCLLVR